MSRLATGRILRVAVRSDRVETEAFGDVDVVDVSATWDESVGRIRLFLANRHLENAADIEVVANGWRLGAASGEYLAAPEGGTRHSTNDRDHENVRMRPLGGVTIDGSTVSARIPALSWCVLELVVETA
jgi:alpha-N-arabinofuranosidase